MARARSNPSRASFDAVLEKVASENGGIYDPQSHLRSLESRAVVVGGLNVTPDAVVDANVRRLQRLARHELVAELPAGRWQVPPDLVSRLKERETTHPRLRVQVDGIAAPLGDQVKLRGPAWLDSAEPRAVHGFGDELARANEQRALHLEQLGIKVGTSRSSTSGSVSSRWCRMSPGSNGTGGGRSSSGSEMTGPPRAAARAGPGEIAISAQLRSEPGGPAPPVPPITLDGTPGELAGSGGLSDEVDNH